MKKLKLLLNIGRKDNEQLKLVETREGQIVEVADEKTAATLLKRGWAIPAPAVASDPPTPKPSRPPAAVAAAPAK
jgi:hypothetical protein